MKNSENKRKRKNKQKKETSTDENEESDFDIFDDDLLSTTVKPSTSKSKETNINNNTELVGKNPLCQKCNEPLKKSVPIIV